MRAILFSLAFTLCHATVYGEEIESLALKGLIEPVTIKTDTWGIPHIYAENQHDLFFAQGFNAARDRLFQFELWRRKALGTLAEIQGEKALQHDIGARLLRFKGNLDKEMAHYHPDGQAIITAFIAGVNAYIRHTWAHTELLPIEFQMLGIKPELWTPEVLLSRHNALTGGLANEITLAKSIHAVGLEKTQAYLTIHRDTPITPPNDINLGLITSDIIALYKASRTTPTFTVDDLAAGSPLAANTQLNAAITRTQLANNMFDDPLSLPDRQGSNNWVIDGTRTASGKPLMANDPHRAVQLPSLRYYVHLNAPGWNVIGGGEPVLPGVSIGHNNHGAWGLTIFWIDQEDLYVYETNPENPNQYRYKDGWQNMDVETTNIKVRGTDPVTETLKYTVHGPVLYEDPENNLAYGLKAAWQEIGASPYLASLRINQAQDWEAFREACTYSGLPGENMIWADKDGTIGWQAVGFTPKRSNWMGRLPVPGDGRHEWNGYIPIADMPHLMNPAEGWYGTANNNNVPKGYPNIFTDFYSDPARITRLRQIAPHTTKHSRETSAAWQYDTLSTTAEILVPIITSMPVPVGLQSAIQKLKGWDYRIESTSIAAAIYSEWETAILITLKELAIPAEQRAAMPPLRSEKMLEWVQSPPQVLFGAEAKKIVESAMITALVDATEKLTDMFGPNMEEWTYGAIHYAQLIHPLSHLAPADMHRQLNTQRLPTSGAHNTLNLAYGTTVQTTGGTFRMIVDTANWDNAIGTNSPGQAGNPSSPYYKNLFEDWNKGQYFPVSYSDAAVDAVTEHIIVLSPAP